MKNRINVNDVTGEGISLNSYLESMYIRELVVVHIADETVLRSSNGAVA